MFLAPKTGHPSGAKLAFVFPTPQPNGAIQVEQNKLVWSSKLNKTQFCFWQQKLVGSSKQSRTHFCVSGTKPRCGHLSGAKPTFVFPAPKPDMVIQVEQNPLLCFRHQNLMVIQVEQNPLLCFWHQPLVTWACSYTRLWFCHKPRFLCR